MIKSPSIGISLIDGLFVLCLKSYKRHIKAGKDILPDNLSGSKIHANSSGIKITSAQIEQKLKLSVIGSDFVPSWHEVTSCQLGERCGSGPFTCSRFGNKSDRENS